MTLIWHLLFLSDFEGKKYILPEIIFAFTHFRHSHYQWLLITNNILLTQQLPSLQSTTLLILLLVFRYWNFFKLLKKECVCTYIYLFIFFPIMWTSAGPPYGPKQQQADQMSTYTHSDTHAASSADHDQMKPINPAASQVRLIGRRFMTVQRDARDNTHSSLVITVTSLLTCCCKVCVSLYIYCTIRVKQEWYSCFCYSKCSSAYHRKSGLKSVGWEWILGRKHQKHMVGEQGYWIYL